MRRRDYLASAQEAVRRNFGVRPHATLTAVLVSGSVIAPRTTPQRLRWTTSHDRPFNVFCREQMKMSWSRRRGIDGN